MKHFLQSLLMASLTIAALLGVSACGQKGPLVVEQPATEVITEQLEEPEDTK